MTETANENSGLGGAVVGENGANDLIRVGVDGYVTQLLWLSKDA